MHRRAPKELPLGFSLVELVLAIVIVGIVVALLGYFVLPLRQATDLVVRAELTDAADNALQRIGREVRLALPNSVRVDPSGQFVEFLAVHTAGRYRVEGYGAGAPIGTPCDGAAAPDSDRLAFGAADDCFKAIGALSDEITTAHRLVLSNYGPGFPGQNAYDSGANQNWRAISAGANAGGLSPNDRIRFTPGTFDVTLHDSPGRRYYIVSGPVTYSCGTTPGQLVRHAGYAIQAAQPTAGLGGGDLLAGNVSRCVFEYQANVAPALGLLTVRLGLSRAVSGGQTETIELVHAIHVRNVP